MKSATPPSAALEQGLPHDQVVLPLPTDFTFSKPEIVYVLFMDIVGFSKFSNEEQTEILGCLQEIVWKTDEYRAQSKKSLLALPTGDGMALVFLTKTDPEPAVKCAQQICSALKQGDPRLKLRMGIHTGPIHHIKDVNKQRNITGDGINTAQRVMDCGDAGHILLSHTVAAFLKPYKEWDKQIHDLREVAVKHKQLVHVYNLHTDEFGNRRLPKKVRVWRLKRRLRAIAIASAALAVTAALAIIIYLYLSNMNRRNIESMAVFPLNVSNDQETEQLSNTITRDIINNLITTSDGLTVRPDPESVFDYRLRRPDATLAAGRELNVQAVLSGTMQRVGSDYSISIKLVDVRNGSPILEGQYPSSVSNINEIAGRITLDILKKLRRGGIPTSPITAKSDAYKLYSQGRNSLDQRTKESIEQSIDYFQKATLLDPNFAEAYAALAQAYNVSSGYNITIENTKATPLTVYPKAIAAAKRAQELKPQLAEAHTELAYSLANFSYKWEEAKEEYAKALKLNPQNAHTHYSYAFNYLISQGQMKQALDEMKLAHELAPESLIISTNLGWAYFYDGQYDEAIKQYQQTLSQNQNFERAHSRLIEVYEQLGDYKSAFAHWHVWATLPSKPEEKQRRSGTVTELENGYKRSQSTGYWEARLKLANEQERIAYVPSYSKAAIYVMLKKYNTALDLLEKAYDDKDEALIKLAASPRFKDLHSDPRFINLVERIRLQFPQAASSNQVAGILQRPLDLGFLLDPAGAHR